MNRTKLGIIGCGKQAEKHISGLKKLPDLEVVLSDIDSELAKDLACKTNSSWVHDPETVFTDGSIQAVVICTPTQTHVSLIKRGIATGKHVFCEKPLSYSLDQAGRLKTDVEGSNQIVLIGYVYRYVPVFEEGFRIFKDQVVDGNSLAMGRPLSAFFRLGGRGSHQGWKHQKAAGGGAINEMLIHMVDLANWYFGPISNIEVISCDLRYPKRLINGEWIIADAEDYILVRCRGADGMEIFCQADLITPAFTQYVEIQAEKGSFMGSIQPEMPSYVFLKEDAGGFSAGKTHLRYGRRNVFDVQMLYFIHCILRQQHPNRNTIGDSLELTQIMNQIAQQAEVKLKAQKC